MPDDVPAAQTPYYILHMTIECTITGISGRQHASVFRYSATVQHVILFLKEQLQVSSHAIQIFHDGASLAPEHPLLVCATPMAELLSHPSQFAFHLDLQYVLCYYPCVACSTPTVSRCACKQVYLCSQPCLALVWPAHKATCTAPRTLHRHRRLGAEA